MTAAGVAVPRPTAGRLDGLPLTTQTLESLYDAHGPRLYRYALLILADADAAEDAVQDSFVQLAKALSRRSPPEVSYAYLAAIVRNACYTTLRRRRTWHAVVSRLVPSREAAPARRSTLLEPYAADASEEERLVLESALAALPPEQREVIYLKVYEGMTFDEIARHCGISLNTAASRYRYASAALRRALEPDAGRR